MSKTNDQFESRKGRPPRYPWEEWTDQETHVLYRGTKDEVDNGIKDFEADLVSFRTMIHRKARDLGSNIGAYTHINKANQSVKVRFYEREERG